MTRTVAFILSTNYAGSHFLSLMIGAHSSAAHVGEVCHLRKHRVGKLICSRCGSFDRCPLFRDIRPSNVDRAHEIVFGALPAATTLLVDNSKRPEWAARFLHAKAFEPRFIHLIRDPRALVRRWDLATTSRPALRKLRRRWLIREPLWFRHWLFSTPRRFYLTKWLAQNVRISRFLRRNALNHVVVTYRDLALDTATELGRVMSHLGRTFEPSQVDYWTVDHHGSQKDDYAFVKTEKTRLFDTRWKDYLTPEESAEFAADPRIVRYLDDLGVAITPDGLTRKDRT